MNSKRFSVPRTPSRAFAPCAPELAYCTDCQESRRQQTCPRLRALRKEGQRLGPQTRPAPATENER